MPGKVRREPTALGPRKRNEQNADRGKDAPVGTIVGRVVDFDVATILCRSDRVLSFSTFLAQASSGSVALTGVRICTIVSWYVATVA